ncbi:gem-associated protein 5-like [Amphibalanus amphitrite]|uniref:gem-associated protein 5-like n=1 Tax=Amphibalanus amphitrite TaxID=1232801 RepID=UPI001C921403|nr:gem-associated protein 5-like [Amphibalanus amphitrite]
MKTVCLTPSANWYSAGALASDGDRLLVGCARQALLLAGPVATAAGGAPSLHHHGVVEDAHRERVVGAVVWRHAPGAVSVVSCGEDALVKLWTCEVGEEEGRFRYHCEKQHSAHGKLKVAAVAHAARSPHVAISVDERGTFVVWDTVAHTTRTLFLEKMAPTELRCSPHTEHVVAVAGKRGLLWTVSLAASGRVLQKLRGHDDDVTSISWCPELTTLLSFEQDHLLASASKDKTIRVWGTRGGRCHVTQRVPAPAEGGGRRQSAGTGGERAWLAVLWTAADCLYSSGLTGQLLRWRLAGDGDGCQVVHRCHGRSLFNIVGLGELVVSSGIQRQLVVHDPRSLLTGTVPCLGGQTAALDTCPVDPGRLAIGCGDHTIRVWNLGADSAYSTVTVWQGIKAKVLTVAWHPHKDTRLAFGTDEGRVGVCDPGAGRPPQLCPEHHAGAVYSVSWSPAGQLFSLSLGAVWRHDASRLTAVPWPPAAGRAACSQLSWGGGGAALGRQDGAVELLTTDGLVRGAALGHRRLVTALRWGPAVSDGGSRPLAVASYDSFVSVFDVPDLDGSGCPELLQARVTLTGHKSRVLDLAWLQDSPTRLVSASQDATVRVWDTVAGSAVAVYSGHHRPVRCCLPHPLLPGHVFSGGDDCSLHLWRVDEQDAVVPETVTGEPTAAPLPAPTGKEKGRTRAGDGAPAVAVNGTDSASRDRTPPAAAAAAAAAQPRELGDGRRARTQRSLFPLSGAAENRGKAHSQADLEHLMAAGDDSAPGGDGWSHVGLFGNDAALRDMVDKEMRHHEAQKSSAQLLHMSLWRGDAAAVVRAAAAEALLTDELLALAPMVSYRFWEEMSLKYAEQLENSKECLKASSVLLACHKVSEAVALLLRHSLYREALCVSRLRLAPDDPSHGRILRLWADQLTTEGNMEQAAKCYLSLGDWAAAAGVLSRRSDPGSLRLAARLWARTGDRTQTRALALLCVHASCLRAEWDVGLAVAREVPVVVAGAHLCVAHRTVTAELETTKHRLYEWAARLLSGEDGTGSTEQTTGDGMDGKSDDSGKSAEEREKEREGSSAESGQQESVTGKEKSSDEQQRVKYDEKAVGEEGRDATAVSSQEDGTEWLLAQLRHAWRTAGLEQQEDLQQNLQEVAYRTIPTSPKQLWLAACSELCLAALESDPAVSAARLVKLLALCQQSVPSQLPLLCALLVPSPRGCLWETGRKYILPALLSVLHQKAHLAGSDSSATPSSSNGVKVAPSSAAGEQSQCDTSPTDGISANTDRPSSVSTRGSVTSDNAGDDPRGSSATNSDTGTKTVISGTADAAPAEVSLSECVRRLELLYVSGRTQEEERMFSELSARLKAL